MKKFICVVLLFFLVGCLVFVYARFIEPSLLKVKSYVVETKMPIQNCKIVFFTDTHFGKLYDDSNLEKIVKKINSLEADIIVFGGDFLDNYARDRQDLDFDLLQKGFSQMKATYKKYAVWGNHDYGGGAVRIFENFMSSSGFEILKDESRKLKAYGINIVGFDDYLMGSRQANYNIESDLYNIVIAHEPIVAQFIKNSGENLILSGHTHGGQINVPFLGDTLLPEGSGGFISGFYDPSEINTKTNLQMYVSSGIGLTRYPFRFLRVPEIIEIDVRHK